MIIELIFENFSRRDHPYEPLYSTRIAATHIAAAHTATHPATHTWCSTFYPPISNSLPNAYSATHPATHPAATHNAPHTAPHTAPHCNTHCNTPARPSISTPLFDTPAFRPFQCTLAADRNSQTSAQEAVSTGIRSASGLLRISTCPLTGSSALGLLPPISP